MNMHWWNDVHAMMLFTCNDRICACNYGTMNMHWWNMYICNDWTMFMQWWDNVHAIASILVCQTINYLVLSGHWTMHETMNNSVKQLSVF